MLFGISFTARPGKEAELERVLSDKEVIRRVTAHMGATLEAVFLQGSRFTEIFDLPAAQPTIARDKILQAHAQPEVQDFLRRLAPLLDDVFNPDDPTSFAAWVQRHKLRLVVDARSPAMPSAASASLAASVGAMPPALSTGPSPGPAKASFERVSLGRAATMMSNASPMHDE